jgi:hypothetical protein
MTYYQFLREYDLGPDSISKSCYQMSGQFDREFLAWKKNKKGLCFKNRIEFWTDQCRDLLKRLKEK